MRDAADPYDLSRFARAQERGFDRALSEIRAARTFALDVVPLFDGCDLAVVNANGTSQTLLTDNPADDIGWAWGADGYIYFSSRREKSVDIWRFKPRLVGG